MPSAQIIKQTPDRSRQILGASVAQAGQQIGSGMRAEAVRSDKLDQAAMTWSVNLLKLREMAPEQAEIMSNMLQKNQPELWGRMAGVMEGDVPVNKPITPLQEMDYNNAQRMIPELQSRYLQLQEDYPDIDPESTLAQHETYGTYKERTIGKDGLFSFWDLNKKGVKPDALAAAREMQDIKQQLLRAKHTLNQIQNYTKGGDLTGLGAGMMPKGQGQELPSYGSIDEAVKAAAAQENTAANLAKFAAGTQPNSFQTPSAATQSPEAAPTAGPPPTKPVGGVQRSAKNIPFEYKDAVDFIQKTNPELIKALPEALKLFTWPQIMEMWAPFLTETPWQQSQSTAPDPNQI